MLMCIDICLLCRLWESGWKQRYYKNKFDVDASDEKFRRKVVQSYVEGLCWVLRYYYQVLNFFPETSFLLSAPCLFSGSNKFPLLIFEKYCFSEDLSSHSVGRLRFECSSSLTYSSGACYFIKN